MSIYEVTVIDRLTGKESERTYMAIGPDHASQQAIDEGWITTGKARPVKPPKPPREPSDDPRGLSVPAVLFAIVAVAGAIWMIVALDYDTTVSVTTGTRWPTTERVYNNGMMHRREVWMVGSATMIVCGVLGAVGCQIIAAVNRLKIV
jgi:hypothetical protein